MLMLTSALTLLSAIVTATDANPTTCMTESADEAAFVASMREEVSSTDGTDHLKLLQVQSAQITATSIGSEDAAAAQEEEEDADDSQWGYVHYNPPGFRGGWGHGVTAVHHNPRGPRGGWGHGTTVYHHHGVGWLQDESEQGGVAAVQEDTTGEGDEIAEASVGWGRHRHRRGHRHRRSHRHRRGHWLQDGSNELSDSEQDDMTDHTAEDADDSKWHSTTVVHHHHGGGHGYGYGYGGYGHGGTTVVHHHHGVGYGYGGGTTVVHHHHYR